MFENNGTFYPGTLENLLRTVEELAYDSIEGKF